MSVTTEQLVPTGTWTADPVHSSIGFAVKHMAVSTFHGRFADYDAQLVSADGGTQLTGVVRVASVDVRDQSLAAHLQGPDFFDVERTPELRFESSSIERQGDEVVVAGELTIKGTTHEVEARGTIDGPRLGFDDRDRIGMALEATVDRTSYGLDWNAPLPKGGFALSNEVELLIGLELLRAE